MTRNSYFDNLKSLLIFSVVIGHLLPSFKGDIDFLETSYLFIYLFHMPLFVLISGYFSKKYNSKGYINKLFVKLIIPYILFQVFYTAFYNYLGSNVEYNFATPRWALWFLVSLFSWNILLFIFAKLKYGIVIAFLISILAGYAPFISAEYSLSRTLFFFPFFFI
jgi:fucose 4-O-acetylase-like acetyltransferase